MPEKPPRRDSELAVLTDLQDAISHLEPESPQAQALGDFVIYLDLQQNLPEENDNITLPTSTETIHEIAAGRYLTTVIGARILDDYTYSMTAQHFSDIHARLITTYKQKGDDEVLAQQKAYEEIKSRTLTHLAKHLPPSPLRNASADIRVATLQREINHAVLLPNHQTPLEANPQAIKDFLDMTLNTCLVTIEETRFSPHDARVQIRTEELIEIQMDMFRQLYTVPGYHDTIQALLSVYDQTVNDLKDTVDPYIGASQKLRMALLSDDELNGLL